MKKLTLKQETFCLNYIKYGNATQAFKATYRTYSMKPKTIYNRSSELMKREDIKGRIKELKKRVEEKALLSAEGVIAELTVVAMSDKITSHKMKALELLGRYFGLDTAQYPRKGQVSKDVSLIASGEKTHFAKPI
jgi:phage terminase small subunit